MIQGSYVAHKVILNLLHDRQRFVILTIILISTAMTNNCHVDDDHVNIHTSAQGAHNFSYHCFCELQRMLLRAPEFTDIWVQSLSKDSNE